MVQSGGHHHNIFHRRTAHIDGTGQPLAAGVVLAAQLSVTALAPAAHRTIGLQCQHMVAVGADHGDGKLLIRGTALGAALGVKANHFQHPDPHSVRAVHHNELSPAFLCQRRCHLHLTAHHRGGGDPVIQYKGPGDIGQSKVRRAKGLRLSGIHPDQPTGSSHRQSRCHRSAGKGHGVGLHDHLRRKHRLIVFSGARLVCRRSLAGFRLILRRGLTVLRLGLPFRGLPIVLRSICHGVLAVPFRSVGLRGVLTVLCRVGVFSVGLLRHFGVILLVRRVLGVLLVLLLILLLRSGGRHRLSRGHIERRAACHNIFIGLQPDPEDRLGRLLLTGLLLRILLRLLGQGNVILINDHTAVILCGDRHILFSRRGEGLALLRKILCPGLFLRFGGYRLLRGLPNFFAAVLLPVRCGCTLQSVRLARPFRLKGSGLLAALRGSGGPHQVKPTVRAVVKYRQVIGRILLRQAALLIHLPQELLDFRGFIVNALGPALGCLAGLAQKGGQIAVGETGGGSLHTVYRPLAGPAHLHGAGHHGRAGLCCIIDRPAFGGEGQLLAVIDIPQHSVPDELILQLQLGLSLRPQAQALALSQAGYVLALVMGQVLYPVQTHAGGDERRVLLPGQQPQVLQVSHIRRDLSGVAPLGKHKEALVQCHGHWDGTASGFLAENRPAVCPIGQRRPGQGHRRPRLVLRRRSRDPRSGDQRQRHGCS